MGSATNVIPSQKRRGWIGFFMMVFLSGIASSQPISQPEIPNWTAPPFWTPPGAKQLAVWKAQGLLPEGAEAVEGLPTSPLPFFGTVPCRIVDTRPAAGFPGAYGPPAMVANASRDFDLNSAAHCPGIPPNAEAYSINVTVTETTGLGDVRIWPAGSPPAVFVSTQNWPTAGLSLANAAIVPAGTGGAITVYVAGSATHLIIDINGYYSPVGIVNWINNLFGSVTLAAGPSVTITPSGNTLTVSTDATSSNTPNTIVRRDGSGGFGAGTVALSGNLTLPESSSASVGNLLQNGARLLHTFGGNNLFLGRDAGNFTMTGIQNTASGASALLVNTSGISNTATGFGTLRNNTVGSRNTADGAFAMFGNTMGSDNTACGFNALLINTSGTFNTAMGVSALLVNETGSDNTAVGATALLVTTGNNNIAVGRYAGGNLTTGDNNIDIGHPGVAAETGTIRIGSASQDRTFLGGVRGVTTGAADGLPVLIDSNGQLGTTSSSARLKGAIADLGDTSAALLRLRPVSFFYRNETEGIRQYGLIAEEVAEVMPELVQFSPLGDAEAVRYHFLGPLLLNEIQNQHRTIEEQSERIRRLEARLAALEDERQAH